LLVAYLALGAYSIIVNVPWSLGTPAKTFVVLGLSAIAISVFLIGRSHARHRQERRNPPPPGP